MALQSERKDDAIPQPEWATPAFTKIKEKRTQRLSPYSETEIWDRDELLTIELANISNSEGAQSCV
jgi:integrase/recombinase XerD